MRPMQDWRVWAALLAGAAVLLAAAVAFAGGGFPGGTERPALPAVVTERPVEPSATPLPSAVATSSDPATASAPASDSPAPTPAPRVVPRPAPRPAPRVMPKPAPAPRMQPKHQDGEREVVMPSVREEAEHDGSSRETSETREPDLRDQGGDVHGVACAGSAETRSDSAR